MQDKASANHDFVFSTSSVSTCVSTTGGSPSTADKN